MKKTVLMFIVVVAVNATGLKAQTKNLAFNQVILVSTIKTVPTGKVWKVEAVAGPRVTQYMYRSRSDADFNPQQSIIKINGNDISAINSLSTGAGHGSGDAGGSSGFTYAGSPTNFPLWLPAGTTLAASTNVTYISVMEFDVVTP